MTPDATERTSHTEVAHCVLSFTEILKPLVDEPRVEGLALPSEIPVWIVGEDFNTTIMIPD